MKKLIAFVAGLREFRQSFTTHYADIALRDAYDNGREFAHRFTLRQFDI